MRNKNFEIVASGLNTHAVQILDTVVTETQVGSSGLSETTTFYPKKIQIINKTGVDVDVNILSSQAEIDAYALNPANYDLFTILDNTAATFSSVNILPNAHRILAQSPAGSATAPLKVQCICYQPK